MFSPLFGRRGFQRWAWTCALVAVSCGADNVDAPYNPSNESPSSGACGTTDDVLGAIKASSVREDFDTVGRLIEDQLVQRGKLRQLLRVGLVMLREVPPVGVSDALLGLTQGEGAAHLMPHLRAILHYFVGSSKLVLGENEQFALGEHMGPVRATAQALRTCRPQSVLEAVHSFLSLRVPCPSCASGTRLFVALAAEKLSAVVEDPELAAILDSLEFSDAAGETAAIGRKAFALLMERVMEGISSSTFTEAYFSDTIRPLIHDVLGRRLSAQANDNLNAFLDVVAQGLDPSLDLLAPTQVTFTCLLRRDPDHEVAGMLFDYVRLKSLNYNVFIANFGAIFETDGSGGALLDYMAKVAKALAADPALARDGIDGILPLLEEGPDKELFVALDNLQGKGVGTGVLKMAARFLGHCAATP